MLYHYYRLVNNVDDRCYIGMTKRELRKRLYEHRHQKDMCSSKLLVEQYGKKNISIILIHSLEYETREEARREERRLIEEYAGRCVNMVTPWISSDEAKERHNIQGRTRYEAHKEEISIRRKEKRKEQAKPLSDAS